MKQRADGRWVKVITQNGRRISFYSRADTEKKAERDIQRQMIEYSQKEEQGKTLLEVSEEWYNIHTQNLAYTTSTRYTRYMNQLNDYLSGYLRNLCILYTHYLWKKIQMVQHNTDLVKVLQQVQLSCFHLRRLDIFLFFSWKK